MRLVGEQEKQGGKGDEGGKKRKLIDLWHEHGLREIWGVTERWMRTEKEKEKKFFLVPVIRSNLH